MTLEVKDLIEGLADYQKFDAELDLNRDKTWDENRHLFMARDGAEEQVRQAIRRIIKDAI